MKLLLSGLLLASLRIHSSQSAPSDTQVVTQTPDVSIMEGETFNITCCWRLEVKRLILTWMKHRTQVKSEVLVKMDFEGLQWKETPDCSNLTLANITREDSGRYTCRVTVEIPFHFQFEGNGTVVNVTSRDNPKDDTDPPTDGGSHSGELLIHMLRYLLLLALIISFCCLNKLGSKAKQRSSAAPLKNLQSAARVEEDQKEETGDE